MIIKNVIKALENKKLIVKLDENLYDINLSKTGLKKLNIEQISSLANIIIHSKNSSTISKHLAFIAMSLF